MNELHILMEWQQQWLDFLNQSKLHQFSPFIFLSIVTGIFLAIKTSMDIFWVVFNSCVNPLSLIVYWMLGVVPFVFIPIMVVFGLFYLLFKLARAARVKLES